MVMKKTEIKCPWCEETMPASSIVAKRLRNEYGTIIERRCSKCAEILAAYLEEEGDFLPKMRIF